MQAVTKDLLTVLLSLREPQVKLVVTLERKLQCLLQLPFEAGSA